MMSEQTETKKSEQDDLLDELALCLTVIRDLRMGYPWDELVEPFGVFFPRIRGKLRARGINDEGAWDVE